MSVLKTAGIVVAVAALGTLAYWDTQRKLAAKRKALEDEPITPYNRATLSANGEFTFRKS